MVGTLRAASENDKTRRTLHEASLHCNGDCDPPTSNPTNGKVKTENGKLTAHPLIRSPLTFPPPQRGTVSYCLLLQNKMAPRNVMPSLFYILSEGGVATYRSLIFSCDQLLAKRSTTLGALMLISLSEIPLYFSHYILIRSGTQMHRSLI